MLAAHYLKNVSNITSINNDVKHDVIFQSILNLGWFGSRVVSVLDSGVRAWVRIASATLSGNSLRQNVHTHCASVHQAAKLVAVLAESNGRVYDSRHLQADYKETGSAPKPYARNRVRATFIFYIKYMNI